MLRASLFLFQGLLIFFVASPSFSTKQNAKIVELELEPNLLDLVNSAIQSSFADPKDGSVLSSNVQERYNFLRQHKHLNDGFFVDLNLHATRLVSGILVKCRFHHGKAAEFLEKWIKEIKPKHSQLGKQLETLKGEMASSKKWRERDEGNKCLYTFAFLYNQLNELAIHVLDERLVDGHLANPEHFEVVNFLSAWLQPMLGELCAEGKFHVEHGVLKA